MIESKEEFKSHLSRLRQLKQKDQLGNHLLSMLQAFEEVEHLIIDNVCKCCGNKQDQDMKRKMEKQLSLTPEELEKIGFNPLKVDGDEMNESKTIYKIDFINGYIYCNPDEKVYKWYHKTIIGGNANHIHLDITSLPILYTFLSCLNIDYELVIV